MTAREREKAKAKAKAKEISFASLPSQLRASRMTLREKAKAKLICWQFGFEVRAAKIPAPAKRGRQQRSKRQLPHP
jgi:hypothetical protein